MDYQNKKKNLLQLLDNEIDGDVAIAFSGGVDSSVLLKLACDIADKKGKKVYAVTFHTTMHPMYEIELSKKIAEEMCASHHIVKVNELEEAGITNNPKQRCYLCKSYMFKKLIAFAKSKHITTIMEGTNLDDLGLYRPGLKALKELQIKSPLAKSQFTKADVRKLAKEYQISSASKPSTPCLATRFPYNTLLTEEDFLKVAQGEAFIKEIGFHNVRLRVHGEVVRVEVDQESLHKILEVKGKIISYLKTLGYQYITLDLEGFRSGSMDIDEGGKRFENTCN